MGGFNARLATETEPFAPMPISRVAFKLDG